jgi:hypothetical protein
MLRENEIDNLCFEVSKLRVRFARSAQPLSFSVFCKHGRIASSSIVIKPQALTATARDANGRTEAETAVVDFRRTPLIGRSLCQRRHVLATMKIEVMIASQ